MVYNFNSIIGGIVDNLDKDNFCAYAGNPLVLAIVLIVAFLIMLGILLWCSQFENKIKIFSIIALLSIVIISGSIFFYEMIRSRNVTKQFKGAGDISKNIMPPSSFFKTAEQQPVRASQPAEYPRYQPAPQSAFAELFE